MKPEETRRQRGVSLFVNKKRAAAALMIFSMTLPLIPILYGPVNTAASVKSPPIADFVWDCDQDGFFENGKCTEGNSVFLVFSGYDPNDPRQRIVFFRWFNKQTDETYSFAPELKTTFPPGSHDISLTVCNESGLCTTANKVVVVNPQLQPIHDVVLSFIAVTSPGRVKTHQITVECSNAGTEAQFVHVTFSIAPADLNGKETGISEQTLVSPGQSIEVIQDFSPASAVQYSITAACVMREKPDQHPEDNQRTIDFVLQHDHDVRATPIIVKAAPAGSPKPFEINTGCLNAGTLAQQVSIVVTVDPADLGGFSRAVSAKTDPLQPKTGFDTRLPFSPDKNVLYTISAECFFKETGKVDENLGDNKATRTFVFIPAPLSVTASCDGKQGVPGRQLRCHADATGGSPPYTFSWDVGKDGRIDGTGQDFSTQLPPPTALLHILVIVRDSNNQEARANPSGHVTFKERVPILTKRRDINVSNCPPRGDRNGGDIDGDDKMDWILEVLSWTVLRFDGNRHRVNVYTWCMSKTSSFSFIVGKVTDGQYPPFSVRYFGPVGRVPGATRPACPFDNGINVGPLFGPQGADGLPTTVTWTSYKPITREPWKTVFDVATGTFTRSGDPPESSIEGCTEDSDSDGLDEVEELENGTNPDNADSDGDGVSDLTEVRLHSDPLDVLSVPEDLSASDSCGDGVDNDLDGLTDTNDGGCVDTEGDSVPDSRDNCLSVSNPGQEDADADGIGAACDSDDDSDNVPDEIDSCLGTPLTWSVDERGCPNDIDVDGICNPGTTGTKCLGSDNCPETHNPDQKDNDRDGIGDACEIHDISIDSSQRIQTDPVADATGKVTVQSGSSVTFFFSVVNNGTEKQNVTAGIFLRSPGEADSAVCSENFSIQPEEKRAMVCTWNTVGFLKQNYESFAFAVFKDPLKEDRLLENNVLQGPSIALLPFHDVGINSLGTDPPPDSTSQVVAVAGNPVLFTVSVDNHGNEDQEVIAHVLIVTPDGTVVQACKAGGVALVGVKNSFSCVWDTTRFPKGKYITSAAVVFADEFKTDKNPDNNAFPGPSVTILPAPLVADLVSPKANAAYVTEPAIFNIRITGGSPGYTCTIDLGDTTSFGPVACTDGQMVSHIYTNPGTYTVTLSVTDANGAATVSTPKTMAVQPEPRFFENRLSWKHHLTTVTQTFVAKITNPSKYTVIATVEVIINKPDGSMDMASGTFALGPGARDANAVFTYDTDILGKYCFTATLTYRVDVNSDGVIDITGRGPNSKSGCFNRV